jgi:hypothetical protein
MFSLIEAFPIGLIWAMLLLFIIGSIIIYIVGALIFFIPAALVAVIVYYITGNENLTGIAFLLVALSSITRRKK